MTRVIHGPHAVEEALRSPRIEVQKIWMDDSCEQRFESIAQQCKQQNLQILLKSKQTLNQVSGDMRHQGIVAYTSDYRFENIRDLEKCSPTHGFYVAFDEIVDPQNLGAMIRSAVAFGAKGIILHKRRSAGITPTVVRASCGATEHAEVYLVSNLARSLDQLQKNNFQIIGLDMNGEIEVDQLSSTSIPAIMVVGSEGKGLRQLTRQKCDIMCNIPMTGPIASLNASVAAGIAFSHLQKLCLS